MAKIGKRDQVWNGLAVINPIGIRDAVPNAELRQSNAYFSSSDGKFANRYEAQERFNELRNGSVAVKGGWRIYSSGPGIYMNQLITNVLGIREDGGDLIIDPVLPDELDGTRFAFEYGGSAGIVHLPLCRRQSPLCKRGRQGGSGRTACQPLSSWRIADQTGRL